MFLKNYIFNFYPLGQENPISEDYLDSQEYKNLARQINKANEWDTRDLKNALKECGLKFFEEDAFVDVTKFDFKDRSFNFQFKFQNDESNLIEFICINISIIAPCFCIYYVNRNIPRDYVIGDKIESSFFNYNLKTIPSKYSILVAQSHDILTDFGLFRIENEFLHKVIPNITFEGLKYNEMSIFNCLFLNEPYVII